MNNNENSNPDRINLRVLAIIIGIVIFIITIAILSTMESSSTIIYGTVEGGGEIVNVTGARKSLLVKLDNGSLVSVNCSVGAPLLKDQKVSIQETKTKLFGFTTYELKEYIRDSPVGRVTIQ